KCPRQVARRRQRGVARPVSPAAKGLAAGGARHSLPRACGATMRLPQRRADCATRTASRLFRTPNPQGDGMTTKPTRPAVLDQIGNTPMVQVTRLDTGCCTLFLKLESQNPGGSIKDRIGPAMVDTTAR